jgi:hypothetical protein
MTANWPASIPRPSWATRNPVELLTDLSRRHQELMQAYVFAMSEASKLGPFFGNGARLPDDETTVLDERKYVGALSQGFIVRLFVEAHVRTKAGEFRSAYMQTLRALPRDEKYEEIATWLEGAAGEWTQLRETISDRWQFLRLLLALSPIALGFVAARIGQTDIYAALMSLDMGAFRTSAFWLFVPAIYLLSLVGMSFQFKRTLFFPQYLFQDHPRLYARAREFSARNVYAMEDELCRLLDRGKSREIQWDVQVSWIADVLLIGLAVLVLIRPYGSVWRSLVFVIVAVFLPVFGTIDWVLLPGRRTTR